MLLPSAALWVFSSCPKARTRLSFDFVPITQVLADPAPMLVELALWPVPKTRRVAIKDTAGSSVARMVLVGGAGQRSATARAPGRHVLRVLIAVWGILADGRRICALSVAAAVKAK